MTVYSQNGYPANQIELTQVYRIPGTERDIRLKRGACGEVLVDFLAKFHKVIEPIDDGQLDDWGYAERNVRGSDTVVSNHASGTAADVNALKHVLGKRGTFSKVQVANLEMLLQQYDGVIRWGGHYQNRADEMHFEIDRPLADVSRVAARLRAQEEEDMDTDLSDEDIKRLGDYIMKRAGVPDPDDAVNRSLTGTLVELQRDVNAISAQIAQLRAALGK